MWWACQDLNLGPHPYQQSTGNRCAAARFPRSRATVGAKVKCSNSLQLSALPTHRNRADIALVTAALQQYAKPLHRYLPAHTPLLCYLSIPLLLHSHFLTNLTRRRSPFLCLIALSSYRPNPRHDSSAGAVRRSGRRSRVRPLAVFSWVACCTHRRPRLSAAAYREWRAALPPHCSSGWSQLGRLPAPPRRARPGPRPPGSALARPR